MIYEQNVNEVEKLVKKRGHTTYRRWPYNYFKFIRGDVFTPIVITCSSFIDCK